MRDRYHTYDLAQSRNLLKMACVHMSARGRRRKRHRSVTGGAAAPGATGHRPLGTPEPPGAAPELHGAPNGANLAARVRAPMTATCMPHATRAHGRLTTLRCGADARDARLPSRHARPRPRRRLRRPAGGWRRLQRPPTDASGRSGAVLAARGGGAAPATTSARVRRAGAGKSWATRARGWAGAAVSAAPAASGNGRTRGQARAWVRFFASAAHLARGGATGGGEAGDGGDGDGGDGGDGGRRAAAVGAVLEVLGGACEAGGAQSQPGVSARARAGRWFEAEKAHCKGRRSRQKRRIVEARGPGPWGNEPHCHQCDTGDRHTSAGPLNERPPAPSACQVVSEAVGAGMAGGAGARHLGVKEWVEAHLSTCSNVASSTNSPQCSVPSRCRHTT